MRWIITMMIMVLMFGCAQSADPVVNDEKTPPEIKPIPEPEPEPEPEPTPTCTDGIKNQGEAKVDCGGPCKPCVSDIKPIDEIKPDPEPEPIKYTISKEQEDAMLEKLSKSESSKFLTSSYPAGLRVGESYTFVFGVTNTALEEDNETFKFRIEFKEARNSMNNPIDVEDDTILTWFENNEFPEPFLNRYDQVTLPVGVTVGDEIAPGRPTVPGTYYFKIYVEVDWGYRWSEYTHEEFNFRVK